MTNLSNLKNKLSNAPYSIQYTPDYNVLIMFSFVYKKAYVQLAYHKPSNSIVYTSSDKKSTEGKTFHKMKDAILKHKSLEEWKQDLEFHKMRDSWANLSD